MPPIRQVSDRQLELLVAFIETYKPLVLGGIGKGPLDQRDINRAWEGLARRLNSIGGGVMKTPFNWKRYWHLLKCRTKAKAADLRRIRVGRGGNPLTDLEKRIVRVIGKVPVEKQPEVLTETQPSYTRGESSAPAPSMGLEVIEIKMEPEYEEVVESQEIEVETSPLKNSACLAYSAGSTGDSVTTIGSARESVTPTGSVHESVAATGSARDPLAPTGTARESVAPTGSVRGSYAANGIARQSVAPTGSRHESVTATGSAREASQKNSRRRLYRIGNLRDWPYDFEYRRIAVQERMLEEIADMGATHKAILGCMQDLVQMFQAHLNK